MRTLVACTRLAGLILHLLRGLWMVHYRFGHLGAAARHACIQQWAGQLLACIGIELVVQGHPPLQGPVLLVSNHISWIDIPLLQAACRCRFVSKAQVKRWPLIGTLADACDTLYIERESRRDAMRVVHRMQESLREGDVVAIFPEGTTSDGTDVLSFHANLLQAAIAAQAPIQPVALYFSDQASGQLSRDPSYVGSQSLLASIWCTLCAPPLRAQVTFGPVQSCQGRDRRRWALALHEEIRKLRPLPPAGERDAHTGQ